MSKIKSSRVRVLAAEEETGIISQITYNQRQNELLGFFGVPGPEHKCLDHFTVPVADGEQGYKTILDAFQSYQIGSYGRAILLNPLQPCLPRIAVLTMPTCNRFDYMFVYRQWHEVERLYDLELKAIIGPLTGHSSDGNSRRKSMVQVATTNEGYRFRPIPHHHGFVFSCRREDTETGYVIHNMCDQDYIHNHKKLLKPLDHASRVIKMGPYLVHMNHFRWFTISLLRKNMVLE